MGWVCGVLRVSFCEGTIFCFGVGRGGGGVGLKGHQRATPILEGPLVKEQASLRGFGLKQDPPNRSIA